METIMITGAGSGLGYELASIFAAKGYHITLIGRTLNKLKKAAETITNSGGQASALALDITDFTAVQTAVNKVAEQYTLAGLVNNAGVGYFGPVAELSPEELKQMIETNLYGTVYMSQAVLPYLTASNTGFLMNIISTAGLRGKVNETGYAASKFAQRGFTESLQKEYAHTNIKINAVYMGGMDTPFWDYNNFVSDRTRLRSPQTVAAQIVEKMDEESIIID